MVPPRWLEYAGVTLVCGLYLFLFVRVQWPVGDEGDMLNGALAVSEGRVPYRDFYDLRGPLAFYPLGLLFRLLGASWFVARAHLLTTGVLSSVLVYHLARRVAGIVPAGLACALITVTSLPSWPASHHHWDSNLYVLAGTAAFFRFLDSRRRGWLVAAGALAGCASGVMYQKGFLLLVACLIVLVARLPDRRVRQPIVLAVAGYAVVGVTLLAWFAARHALPDLIDETIRTPLSLYGDQNRVPYAFQWTTLAFNDVAHLRRLPTALMGLAGVLSAIPPLLVAALPLVVIGAAAWVIVTRPPGEWRRLDGIAYAVTGVALWMSETHRPDIMHLIYGAPLLVVAVAALVDRTRISRRVVATAARLVGVALLTVASVQAVRALSADTRIATRRGTIIVPGDDPALRFLVSDNVPRGSSVFVYPYYSTYYFLADVRNPTRFGEFIYGSGVRPFVEEAVADLEATETPYVLVDTVVTADTMSKWFPAYVSPSTNDRPMEDYLDRHYEPLGQLGRFTLLRRRPRP